MDELDEIVSPVKTARAAWKIAWVLIPVTVIGLGTLLVLHYSFHVFKQVDAAATTVPPIPPAPKAPEDVRPYLVRASENVKLIDSEIGAAEVALKNKAADMKTRTVSREDDRKEFDRLNNRLLELKSRRGVLIADYNTNLRLHPQPDMSPIEVEQPVKAEKD